MPSAVESLAELRRFHKPESLPAWHAYIIQPELSGGKTSERHLDALSENDQLSTLTISGLDQRTFEALVKRFGNRLTGLHLWKCPRISDLSPMEGIPGLTHLAMFWNQKATRLWNLKLTQRLRALHFTDFIKLDVLDDLATGNESLQTLEFGNAISSRYVVRTLEPLARLPELRSLSFNAQTIVDGRVQPLARLQNLDELHFPARQFTTDQLAWLRAKLPATLQSSALEPARLLRQPLRRGTKQLDLLVNGRRGPFLSSVDDAKRVEKYALAFRARVEHFAANPAEEPDPGRLMVSGKRYCRGLRENSTNGTHPCSASSNPPRSPTHSSDRSLVRAACGAGRSHCRAMRPFLSSLRGTRRAPMRLPSRK